MCARLSPAIACGCYTLSSAVALRADVSLLCLIEATILFSGFVLKKKIGKKAACLPFISLFLALAVFVFFAPFTPYILPPVFSFLNDGIVQKIAIAGLIYLLSAAFSVALRALLYRFLKCRLKTEEIAFSLLLFWAAGIALCRAFTPEVYAGVSLFLLLFYADVTKDLSATLAAFVLSVPAAVCGVPPEKYFLFGAAVTAFAPVGRLPAVFALILSYFLFGITENVFAASAASLVPWVLCVLLPSLVFLLLPPSLLRRAENKLVFIVKSIFRELRSTGTALPSANNFLKFLRSSAKSARRSPRFPLPIQRRERKNSCANAYPTAYAENARGIPNVTGKTT